MRPEQSAQRATLMPIVVDVRRVRVAWHVGEGVMLAVIGDPGDQRTLERGRAKCSQHEPHAASGLEGAMGEVAVEPDSHAESDRHIRDREHHQVVPMQGPVPELPAGETQAHERHHGYDRRSRRVKALVGDWGFLGCMRHGSGS